MKNFYNQKRGISLIEVVVASAIISVTVVSIFGVFATTVKMGKNNIPHIQAALLAEEGAEAVKMLRDFGWAQNVATLSNGTTYRLGWDGSRWTATTSAAMIDNKFDRTFVLSSVSRDSNFDVVTSGGTSDSGSRKAVVSVSWMENGATTTKNLEFYIFDSFNN